jgi:hypothetical protein
MSSGLSATLLAGEKLDNPLSMYLGDLMTVYILINTCYLLESLFKGLEGSNTDAHTRKINQTSCNFNGMQVDRSIMGTGGI